MSSPSFICELIRYEFGQVVFYIGEDGARWGCEVRWGGTGIQYFRGDWMGTLVLFSSYRLPII